MAKPTVKLPTVKRVGLRIVAEGRTPYDGEAVSGPRQAFRLVESYFKGRATEHLLAIGLDAQNFPIHIAVVSQGSLNTTRAHPREIFRAAIVAGCMGVLLVHNHPSGCLDPSPEDIAFTKAVRTAGEIVGIEVYDHIIVAAGGFTSIRERGLI